MMISDFNKTQPLHWIMKRLKKIQKEYRKLSFLLVRITAKK